MIVNDILEIRRERKKYFLALKEYYSEQGIPDKDIVEDLGEFFVKIREHDTYLNSMSILTSI